MAAAQTLSLFKSKLKEVETVARARRYVPKNNATYKCLQDVITNHIEALRSTYDIFLDHCALGRAERSRLVDLHGVIVDMPQAQKVVHTILLTDIQKVVEHASPEHLAKGDLSSQRRIIIIWKTLQAEKIDNKAVDEAILSALISQSRTSKDAVKRDDSEIIKAEENDEGGTTLPHWSIPLDTIILSEPRRIFETVRMSLEYNPHTKILTLQISGTTVPKGPPTSRTRIRRMKIISHSPDKKYVRLAFDDVTRGMTDIIVTRKDDGQRLIGKLAGYYDCYVECWYVL